MVVPSQVEDIESEEVAMLGGGKGLKILAREVSESMRV